MMRLLILLFCCTILFSCKKEKPIAETCTVEINQRLKNPNELSSEISLDKKIATHHYVKFHIYNIQQYHALEKQGIILLDHPFDAIPDKNLQYETAHTKQYGIYYGVAPKSVNIDNYEKEILSALYMPEVSTTMRTSETPSKQFAGSIKFFDPIDSLLKPLKGVQIIIKEHTKMAIGLTDENGNFSFESQAITADTAEVLLKFDNDYLQIHTLDAANLFGIFGVNTYSLGFRKSCAFTDLQIEIGRTFNNAALHHSCAALLALNSFKKFASNSSFLMPTKKFNFWLGKEAPISTSYATPMLHNMTQQQIANPTRLITNLFGVSEDIAELLSYIIGDQLPDIYAPYYSIYATTARASFIETMYHELAHASHFAKVGTDFWLPYVEYIYTNGGYGEPTFSNSGIIGLSEAWAEDVSNIGLFYTYQKQKYINFNEHPFEDWIPYGLYYDLYDTGNNEIFDNVSAITFPEMYSLLTTDTRSLQALKIKLKNNYPSQQAAIDLLFQHYGF
ncbi:MAG: hypothetical protein U0T07_02825 [Chitinophagales bacterium]|nr:hypothetical protein [Chitinophagales bacterium]